MGNNLVIDRVIDIKQYFLNYVLWHISVLQIFFEMTKIACCLRFGHGKPSMCAVARKSLVKADVRVYYTKHLKLEGQSEGSSLLNPTLLM